MTATVVGFIIVGLWALWGLVLRSRVLRAPGSYDYCEVTVADAFGVAHRRTGLSLKPDSIVLGGQEIHRWQIDGLALGNLATVTQNRPLVAGVMVGPLLLGSPFGGVSTDISRVAQLHVAGSDQTVLMLFDAGHDAAKLVNWVHQGHST